MAGIIHLHQPARRLPGLSRRALMLGAAGFMAASSVERTLAFQGTPADPGAAPGTAQGRLNALLRLVPVAALGGPDPDQWLFSWVDLETHFAALGVTDWRDPDVSIVEVTNALAVMDNLIQHALSEEAQETFGFSALDASQILVAGNPPDQVAYYAGLPVDRLPAVWEKAGFERMDGEFGPYWTAGQEGELDMTSPISTIGVGALNNVAILNDEVVVFARTARLLQQVQGLVVDGGDAELVEVIETLPDDTVNVIALPGQALAVSSITPEGGQVTGADILAESDDAVGAMPPLALALFGITAGARTPGDGGTPVPVEGPEARFLARLLTDSPEDAALAAEVVAWRVENMASAVSPQPYSELMTLETPADEQVAGNVATLDFSAVENIGFWHRMLFSLDLWPFAWSEE
jgi:hypothetical protein